MAKKKNEKEIISDIDEMINEKRKNTEDLTDELKKAQKEYKSKVEKDVPEENFAKTQILELTRQMKFNFEEKKEENKKKMKYGISPLNIVGELNLFCIGYYIYLLAFTNFQDVESRYMLNGGIIIGMVLLFGLSVITPKKISKIFHILNILIIILFIIFNTYTLVN